MRNHRLVLFTSLVCLAGGWLLVEQLSDHGVAHAQQPSAPAEPVVLRAETRLVLVDTVVTDKKGNYVSDLAQKDFKVWEDGKEQALSSFSYEDSADSHSQPHYMVLFFDNSTMDFSDQIKARDAAAKFIDANAGPNRLIAIADFGGTVRISQNFTEDPQRLKHEGFECPAQWTARRFSGVADHPPRGALAGPRGSGIRHPERVIGSAQHGERIIHSAGP